MMIGVGWYEAFQLRMICLLCYSVVQGIWPLKDLIQFRLLMSSAEPHVKVGAPRTASVWLFGLKECSGFHVVLKNVWFIRTRRWWNAVFGDWLACAVKWQILQCMAKALVDKPFGMLSSFSGICGYNVSAHGWFVIWESCVWIMDICMFLLLLSCTQHVEVVFGVKPPRVTL